MKNLFAASFAFLLLASISAFGSPELDKAYGLRSIVGMVINTEQDPVFTEHVENEIVRYLKSRQRFEFNDEAYVAFRDEVREIYLRDSKVPTQDKVEWIRPQLQKLRDRGVDAAIISEVFHLTGQYRITLVMVSTNDLEYIEHKDLVVEDSTSMESFSQTVTRGMDELERRIPFDGSIVRRNGFRVVIDRGAPDMHPGEELITYTVEKRGDEEVVLEETGVIRILEVGEQLSFGTILVERKPREVTTMNKILLTGSEAGRELAFARISSVTKAKELGEIMLLLGGTSITVNNVSSAGAGASESGKLFPGGSFRGEVWLTNKTFLMVALDFGMGTLKTGNGAQNANVNDFRIGFSYQIPLGRGEWNPRLRVRGGYARHSFSVDGSSDPLAFNSTTYSGILAGGGVVFKINDAWETGFNVNTFLFPGASESPLRSGDVAGVSAWDFALFANYHYNENMDVVTRLIFNSYRADFTGTGNRPLPVSAASQSGQSFLAGVAYFF